MKSGYWSADALEVRGWMRLQVCLTQLIHAHLQLASAVVAVIDSARDADRRWECACEAVDTRRAALTQAAASLQTFLTEHGRVDEALGLAAEVSAVIAPVPPAGSTGTAAAAG